MVLKLGHCAYLGGFTREEITTLCSQSALPCVSHIHTYQVEKTPLLLPSRLPSEVSRLSANGSSNRCSGQNQGGHAPTLPSLMPYTVQRRPAGHLTAATCSLPVRPPSWSFQRPTSLPELCSPSGQPQQPRLNMQQLT